MFREGSADLRHFRFLANLRLLPGGCTRRTFLRRSQELMQDTGNEEHTRGKRADCPLKSEVRVSNP